MPTSADHPPADLPVGFQRFHRNRYINYQLNRAHALGYARGDDLLDAASRVRSLTDCPAVFEDLAERARTDDRLTHATTYLRLVEFFTPPRSAEKTVAYTRYRASFDEAFSWAGITRHEVPYGSSSLSAYTLGSFAGTPAATILVHGGFDSLIEEFFAIWQRIAAAGFDVVAFDGPGQGGSRALGGLAFDHDWEHPVAAILDHFELDSAGLVGISMGGYWALRAAGREPRIDRVVSWPPVYDWLRALPRPLPSMVRAMARRRRFMNWSVRVRTRLSPTLCHAVTQALYIADATEPVEAVDWFLGMNAAHLGSERVEQDVLLMVGEHDKFQPPVLARRQAAALSSARSVCVRTFTEAEQADEHCQMGNLDLACRELTGWLESPGTSGVGP